MSTARATTGSIAGRRRTRVRLRDVLDAMHERWMNEVSPWALLATIAPVDRSRMFAACEWFCNQVRTRIEEDEKIEAHKALKAAAANENRRSGLIMPGDANWSAP